MRSIFVSVRQGKLAKWQNDFLNEAMRWIFAVMIVLSRDDHKKIESLESVISMYHS